MVVRPDIPTLTVVECLADGLPPELRRHNRTYADGARIQLRAAVDVGPVVSDPVGISGETIIRTSRLLDAADFKAAMSDSGAILGIITSSFVYETAIKHARGSVDRARYGQVQVLVKETSTPAWMQLLD